MSSTYQPICDSTRTMSEFVETPIPCPYVVGAKFHLHVSSPDGMAYEAHATVTHIFAPFTISPVMKVRLDPQHLGHSHLDLPSELVFKVFDRRFALSLRTCRKLKPPTYESEIEYRQYVESGNAPNGSAAIAKARNANYLQGIGIPRELTEHKLATDMAPYFGSECAAYGRLACLQGVHIPRFYGSTCFSSKSTFPLDGLDVSVPGVLLEFVPGVNLDRVDPSLVNLDALIHSALNVIELYSDLGLLNRDVRLENMIVKPDGSGVVMIDFAQSRLRGQEETDEEWKRAKWSADEEGCIGYIAESRFNWNYVPSDKYLVLAEEDD